MCLGLKGEDLIGQDLSVGTETFVTIFVSGRKEERGDT